MLFYEYVRKLIKNIHLWYMNMYILSVSQFFIFSFFWYINGIYEKIADYYNRKINTANHDICICFDAFSLRKGDILHYHVTCMPRVECTVDCWATIFSSHIFSIYRQVFNIGRTLVGNNIVDHSDVVGTPAVGAAPIISSFWT